MEYTLADLDRDRHVGGSRPNQNDYFFVIFLKHPKSYIETTDRHDFGGNPSKWSEDGCYIYIVKHSVIL